MFKLRKEGITLNLGSSNYKSIRYCSDLSDMFSTELTMRLHINNISLTCFKHLRRLGKYFVSPAELLCSVCLSVYHFETRLLHLDACWIPACALEHLQRVLHASVQLVVCLTPHDYVTKNMKELHWLPIVYRIKFKLFTLFHGAVFNQRLSFIRDFMCQSLIYNAVHVESQASPTAGILPWACD